MKTILFAAAMLVAGPVAAQSNDPLPNSPHPDIGRYQIASASCTDPKNCVAFGIDTATGAVFACQYTYTPGIYDFGGQCKSLPHRAEKSSSSGN